MESLQTFAATHPFLYALLCTVFGAIAVDLKTFVDTKDPGNFVDTFNFKTAGYRYMQSGFGYVLGNGLIAGVLGASTTVTAIIIWTIWR